jgi:hypothetical protein
MDSPHPLFPDQRDYDLQRAVIDTGDADVPACVTITFKHKVTGRTRRFLFSQARIRSFPFCYYGDFPPVYVGTTQGRQWEPGCEIEVGDLDPGDVWFYAAGMEEIKDAPAARPT